MAITTGSIFASIAAVLPEVGAGAVTAGALAADGTALAAGGGLLSFLPEALTVTGILSGVMSGAAALSSYGRGVAEQNSRFAQADMYEERATTEGLIAASDATKARRALLDTLGKQAVGYAASGVDLSAGTVKIAQQQAADKAESDLSVADTASKLRQASYRRQAAALRSEGTLAYTSGVLGAVGNIAKGGIDILKRG